MRAVRCHACSAAHCEHVPRVHASLARQARMLQTLHTQTLQSRVTLTAGAWLQVSGRVPCNGEDACPPPAPRRMSTVTVCSRWTRFMSSSQEHPSTPRSLRSLTSGWCSSRRARRRVDGSVGALSGSPRSSSAHRSSAPWRAQGGLAQSAVQRTKRLSSRDLRPRARGSSIARSRRRFVPSRHACAIIPSRPQWRAQAHLHLVAHQTAREGPMQEPHPQVETHSRGDDESGGDG